MNRKIRNEFANHGLEVLKKSVRLVLYEPDVTIPEVTRRGLIPKSFQQRVRKLLGIKEVEADNDNLIHGILLRLQDNGHNDKEALPTQVRNEFADHGLEILKWCVLLVLYEYKISGRPLPRTFQPEIRDQLGIQRAEDGENDQLIHGILLRLRHDEHATYIDDENALPTQEDKWVITEKGISAIETK